MIVPKGNAIMGDGDLWNAVNDLRDRMARQEERGIARDTKIEKMDEKLDSLVNMATQAEGAGKAAMLFGKWGYGFGGVIGATIISNWTAIRKALF